LSDCGHRVNNPQHCHELPSMVLLQEVGGLKDALHLAEERVKGLQAAYEQAKAKAEVPVHGCPANAPSMHCQLLRMDSALHRT
jgi:hypothetical protein